MSMELTLYRKLSSNLLNEVVGIKENCWIRSPLWDGFWLHSGLWLTLLMILLDSLILQEMFYAVGVFLFWISHRFSSFYIAWGTRAYKSLRKNQQKRFVILPIFIVLFVFGVLFTPETVFPVTVFERILGLLLLDFAWGVHHFAAQHYGILRLYHQRFNPESAASAKKQDRIFCWGVGGVMVVIAELLHGTSFLQEKHFIQFLPKIGEIDGIPLLMRFGTLLVIGVTFFMIRKAWSQDSGLPRLIYLSGVGILVMSAFQLEPFQFLMLWTLQHWMVALGLATHMVGNDTHQNFEKTSTKSEPNSSKHYNKTYLVLFFLCVFSAIMTPLFEIEAISFGSRYSEYLFPTLIEWLQNSEWYIFLVGIGLAGGFLHYWMDRSVYRFSDKQTHKSAQQLLI